MLGLTPRTRQQGIHGLGVVNGALVVPSVREHRRPSRCRDDDRGRKGEHIDNHDGIANGSEVLDPPRTPFETKLELALVVDHVVAVAGCARFCPG